MKSIKKYLLAVVLFGYASIAASVPTTITDTVLFSATDAYDSATGVSALNDFGRSDVNYLSTNEVQFATLDFDYVAWTHDFAYDPSWGSIVDATLSLVLRDASDALLSASFGLVIGEDGTVGAGAVATGTYDFGLDATFVGDGTFSVALASLLGSFYIDSAILSVSYDPEASVPEPTTLSIFGLALIMIGLLSRSRKGSVRNSGSVNYA